LSCPCHPPSLGPIHTVIMDYTAQADIAQMDDL
jgi:hypothetical protein